MLSFFKFVWSFYLLILQHTCDIIYILFYISFFLVHNYKKLEIELLTFNFHFKNNKVRKKQNESKKTGLAWIKLKPTTSTSIQSSTLSSQDIVRQGHSTSTKFKVRPLIKHEIGHTGHFDMIGYLIILRHNSKTLKNNHLLNYIYKYIINYNTRVVWEK